MDVGWGLGATGTGVVGTTTGVGTTGGATEVETPGSTGVGTTGGATEVPGPTGVGTAGLEYTGPVAEEEEEGLLRVSLLFPAFLLSGFQTVPPRTPKIMARAMMLKIQKVFFFGLRRFWINVLPPAAELSL